MDTTLSIYVIVGLLLIGVIIVGIKCGDGPTTPESLPNHILAPRTPETMMSDVSYLESNV